MVYRIARYTTWLPIITDLHARSISERSNVSNYAVGSTLTAD